MFPGMLGKPKFLCIFMVELMVFLKCIVVICCHGGLIGTDD